jgi:tetratricopeptide (TPR) repeat protein
MTRVTALWGVMLVLVFGLGSCKESTRAHRALEVGDYVRARASFNLLLDRTPDHMEYRQGLVLAILQQAKDSLNPMLLQDWYTAGAQCMMLMAHSREPAVLELCNRVFVHTAYAYMRSGRLDVAMDWLHHALQLEDVNVYALNLKALILREWNQKQQAEEVWNLIQVQHPGFIPAYLHLGHLYWDAQDYAGAWLIWKEALQQDSSYDALLYWYQQAEIKLLEGQGNAP